MGLRCRSLSGFGMRGKGHGGSGKHLCAAHGRVRCKWASKGVYGRWSQWYGDSAYLPTYPLNMALIRRQ